MLKVQPVTFPEDLGSDNGFIIFCEDVVVAVVARLSADFYGAEQGKWHVEVAFAEPFVVGAVIDDLESFLQARVGKPQDQY